MGTLSEADLNTCLKTLESCGRGAADGDRADESRMLDVLKQLQKGLVTAELLKRTNAGKRLNKFCKHSCVSVAQAAKAAVEAWKQCVKQEQQQNDGGEAETPDAVAQREAPASTSQPGLRAPLALTGKASAMTSGVGAGQRPTCASFIVDPPRCGNDTRDKVRVMLAEALAVGFNSGGAVIEDALHELLAGSGSSVSGEYKAKARSLCFNLKDAKNPDLRERVLSGSIPPESLVRMSAEELASDEQKRKNREMKEWLAKEATRGVNNAATTDMFQCGRCKQRKCTYYPMTTFVTCTNCGQRWKFC
ncbi:hypothetical protein VOLCADRAFT_116341 [Volvox carteri f. nagariensis]|uniref:Transcription elongation factor n=1 Tax=Volvox carteri f. nagariensis TaxID=3068 RepID=D8TL94_VOLCA|nr:uncharacterized protein VOLCADRAFT_116341 [Volvox carteri f. nagariensis]EFJ51833.1 hypothetical protein VOLCADRAFT_116341 [Volvox carteri f. nagariensis]|eukprot:XP_002947243.1 hypothetical protein VOLCADRAFT_116341 [Volvox carteri f. nagariensis]